MRGTKGTRVGRGRFRPGTGRRAALLASFLVLSGMVLPAVGAPAPAGKAASANTWVLDARGAPAGSYRIGENAWTVQASVADGHAKIAYQDLDSGAMDSLSIALAPGTGTVLVNDLRGATTPLAASLPGMSLAGLDPPLLDAARPEVPGVRLQPNGGTFAATVRVILQAVPPAGGGRVSVHWRVDGGQEYCDQRLSPGQSCVVALPVLFFARSGEHRLEAWAEGGADSSEVVAATFRIQPPAGADKEAWQRRDTDGDAIPDLVEIPLGLDPLAPSLARDADNDGWSDFDEILRASDPARADSRPRDTDNDGWSDFDEKVRGTDPDDKPLLDTDGDRIPDTPFFPDRPAATRLYEVEYLVDGAVYPAVDATERQRFMGRLTARDLHWRLLYDQDRLPSGAALEAIGMAEDRLPERFRATTAARMLEKGQLPPLRLPAGEPLVLRAVRLDRDGDGVEDRWDNCPNIANAGQADADGDGVGDACAAGPGEPPALWVVKGWLPAAADAGPAGFAGWLAAQGKQWPVADDPGTTAAAWLELYTAYLADVLVQRVPVRLDPASGLGIALVEGLLHWFSGMSDGTRILLGNGIAADQGRAVETLRNTLAGADPAGLMGGIDRLHSALLDQASDTGPLAPFRELVFGYYAHPERVAAASTTEAAYRAARGDHLPPDLAALLSLPVRLPQAGDGTVGDGTVPPEVLAEIQAVYLARLLVVAGPAVLDDAPAGRRQALLDPLADYDGDGLANLLELAAADPRAVSDPTAEDTDGDGIVDGKDRCAADPMDLCPAAEPVDADGDGWPVPADRNDQDPSVHPGAVELCDNKDNDQDGQVDENACLAAGDLDGNGTVGLADALVLLRFLAGLEPADAGLPYLAGDPDGSGRLDAADLALLLAWLAAPQ